ncbi:MAG: hypothetical protein IIY48_07985 [Clostridia bacterium]|nr:hypothetical protein [Clostridia bacterium]
MKDIIATEKFKVELYGKTYDCEAKLLPSGAFQYGNQTCVVVEINDGAPPRLYDTRYEQGCSTPELFHDWALELLKTTLNPDCVITRA